ncbi:MAG: tRNA pseudouridine(55) synthase TruB [Rickettsiales bacterium]|nr:tRNA pseudouridine(55) synthase TruB [Rickettsiales bacterium]
MLEHGWINIDKPEGMSSAQAVAIVKKLLKAKRVGHAGTLDPMATGILPIAFGKATKTMRFVQGHDKEYVFTLKFGEATDSYDRTGKVIATSANYPTLPQIKSALKNFVGEIEQTPPIYSAVKVGGKRAYNLARANKSVVLPSRVVNIKTIQIESYDVLNYELTLRMLCGKGTYVRSIAHDLAKNLHSCGHVVALRRTKVGIFDNKNIIPLEKFKKIVHNDQLERAVLLTWKVLDDILALNFSSKEAEKIIHGNAVLLPKYEALTDKDCVLARADGIPIGIGKIDGQYFKPTTIFNF